MDPRFEVDPSYPRQKYDFTNSGWLYKIQVTAGTFGSFYLVDGVGLIGSSNAIFVVSNSPAGFVGQTGTDPRRKIEVYGITPNTNCMIEFRAPGSSTVAAYMQVEVLAAPGNRPKFVKPSALAAALVPDEPGMRNQYHLNSNTIVKTGPPETLFDPVPNGTAHVVLSTHGQMDRTNGTGITLSIAGGINRSNCVAVFSKLKSKKPQGAEGVLWISGCEAGADDTFCRDAAHASGYYIAAAVVAVTVVRVPVGMIDFFDTSMIKFFEKDSGTLMKRSDFLMKQKDLQFALVTQ